MKVRNLRARPVVMAVPGHDPVRAAPGETIDVNDDLGQLLAAQTDRWEPVLETRQDDGQED